MASCLRNHCRVILNICGLPTGKVLQIEGKIDEITWTPPVDAASLAHAWIADSLTFVAKCAHEVVLYVFVVEKNVTMAKSGIQTTVNTISSCWKLWTFSWKGIYGCSTRHRQLICLTRQQLYWWYIEPHYMSYHWKQRFSTCFWCLQSNNMAGLQTIPGWALTIVMLHTRKWSKTFDIFMIRFSFSCLRNLWYVQSV